MGIADWLAENSPRGDVYQLDRSAPRPVMVAHRISIPRVKLVLGKGQRRSRRRRLARTAPFVAFTLGWVGNIATRSPNFSTEVLFTR